jgi:uncharacterized protein (TIGR02001 family)
MLRLEHGHSWMAYGGRFFPDGHENSGKSEPHNKSRRDANMTIRVGRLAAGTATLAAAAMLLAAPTLADGYRRGSIKDAKPEERCKHSANVALATEYVFRGVSQTKEGPAIQGGFDLTCGIFYAGVWASNLDWGGTALFGFPGDNAVANIEMDWYLGIKPVTGHITWDIGVIYYTYPNSARLGVDALGAVDRRDYNYVELKVGASAEVWKDGTAGVTVFYSPEYQYESGSVWTVEGSFTQVLPKFNAFHRTWTPSVSALLGWQKSASDKAVYINNVTGDDDGYLYWNVGLTLGFLDKWSLDFRYWDTNIDRLPGLSPCSVDLFSCDQRFVGTLKFTF